MDTEQAEEEEPFLGGEQEPNPGTEGELQRAIVIPNRAAFEAMEDQLEEDFDADADADPAEPEPRPWPDQPFIMPGGRVVMAVGETEPFDSARDMEEELMLPNAKRRREKDVPRAHPRHWRLDNQHTVLPSRLTGLFINDLRLWKLARSSLRELYVTTMVAIPQFKRQMGITFATAYRELTESFLFSDRDPDQSIILFSVQIFTVPSIAEILVKEHHFLTTLLAVCYTYYSERKIGKPEDVNINAIILNDVYHFRSRRHYHIINDLRYLLCTLAVQKNIPSMPSTICQFIDWITLFQGQNPQERKTGKHVEFESDNWISAFNVTMQIAKHVQMFARTFENADYKQLEFAIEECCNRLTSWANADYAILRPKFEPLEGVGLSDIISFHHPLHWLLVGLSAHPAGPDILTNNFYNVVTNAHMYQYPLKVIHICWEIRCGLWVRNGQSARVQLYHYSKVDTREYCIDRDIQFVQLVMAAHGPSLRFGDGEALGWTGDTSTVTPEYLAHFNRLDSFVADMLKFFHSVPPADYTGQDLNLINMQDHMFFFFITLFSERSWMVKLTEETPLVRSLRQGLLFGPQSYSEIAKMVNDDYGDEAHFEQVLNEIADYHPPTGLEDVGKFSLKDQEFAKANPYFYQYTLQQVDEANEVLLKRQQRSDIALLSLDGTSWSGIVDFVFSTSLQDWIIAFLHSMHAASIKSPDVLDSRESLIDKILQLLLLTLQEEESRRSRGAITMNWGVLELSAADFIVRRNLVSNAGFRAHATKLKLIQERFLALNGESMNFEYDNALEATSVADAKAESIRRKALAQARQAKLMSDMRSSQAAFMDNHFDSVDAVLHEAEDMELSQPAEATWQFPTDNCLICQNTVATDGRTYGVLACAQASVLDRGAADPQLNPDTIEDIVNHPSSMDRECEFTPASPMRSTGPGKHKWSARDSITTCGHVMHWQCFDSWYGDFKQRNRSNLIAGRTNSAKVCFQCPLCQTVGNMLLPIISPTLHLRALPAIPSDYDETSMESLLSRGRTEYDLADLLKDADDLKGNTSISSRLAFLVKNDTLSLDGEEAVEWESHEIWAKRVKWPDSFRQSMLEHSCRAIGDDNYSKFRETPWFTTQAGILTASIVDIEVALRDKAGSNRGGCDIHGMLTDQHIVNLRAQSAFLKSMHLFAPYSITAYGDREGDLYTEDLTLRLAKRYMQLRPATSFDDLNLDPIEGTEKPRPLLEEDIFSVLVELSILDHMHRFDMQHLTNLLYEAELVKVVIFCARAILDGKFQDDCDRLASDLDLWPFRIWCETITGTDINACSLIKLLAYLERCALVFVRKCALLIGYCLDFILPEGTTEERAGKSELQYLSERLGIRSLEDIFTGLPGIPGRKSQFVNKWLRHVESEATNGHPAVISLSHPLPFSLIELPKALDTLFERCLVYKCARCNTTPNQPAICLFCGQILCFQSQCCWNEELSLGECSLHTRTCGKVVGLFLVVKRAALLIMKGDSGSFAPAPYLDIHGETDPDLRRGKPQFLNEKRYELGVRQLFLQHQIPTWLSAKMEAYDVGGWQTI